MIGPMLKGQISLKLQNKTKTEWNPIKLITKVRMMSAEFLECPYDDAIESNHEKDGQDDGTGDDEVGLVGAEVTFGQFELCRLVVQQLPVRAGVLHHQPVGEEARDVGGEAEQEDRGDVEPGLHQHLTTLVRRNPT